MSNWIALRERNLGRTGIAGIAVSGVAGGISTGIAQDARGGLATLGEITALPFPDRSFDLVCAFDILEHIENDRQSFRELSRVTKDNATVIFSIPLHPARWSAFDALVGHVRRYDSEDLLTILREHVFVLERSAAPERLAPRPRRVGPDSSSDTGDALVQQALSPPSGSCYKNASPGGLN